MLLDDLSEASSYCRVISLDWLDSGAREPKESEESEFFGLSIVLAPDSDEIKNARRCRVGVDLLETIATFAEEYFSSRSHGHAPALASSEDRLLRMFAFEFADTHSAVD